MSQASFHMMSELSMGLLNTKPRLHFLYLPFIGLQ